ncbi:MAG: hypothetical protein ACRD3J_21455, partial [Thermoanaerobaculia bacterium]
MLADGMVRAIRERSGSGSSRDVLAVELTELAVLRESLAPYSSELHIDMLLGLNRLAEASFAAVARDLDFGGDDRFEERLRKQMQEFVNFIARIEESAVELRRVAAASGEGPATAMARLCRELVAD